jgi:hypothetical protein
MELFQVQKILIKMRAEQNDTKEILLVGEDEKELFSRRYFLMKSGYDYKLIDIETSSAGALHHLRSKNKGPDAVFYHGKDEFQTHSFLSECLKLPGILSGESALYLVMDSGSVKPGFEEQLHGFPLLKTIHGQKEFSRQIISSNFS